jgi:cytochrome b6-f complex iron-sulfur subunit
VIRTTALDPGHDDLTRRQLLRMGFFAATALAATELVVTLAPFIRVTRITGLGAAVATGMTAADVLARFAATNDEPILFAQHRFFLIHPPGGIAAAYRKCTHLGCAVPFSKAEDRFHCPCHGSIYDKRTALLIRDPAPRPLDLFHIRTDESGRLIVETNPLQLMTREDNKWHDEHLEVRG